MKKILAILFLFSAFCFNNSKADAITFEEGLTQSKPMALLIYADWADNVSEMKQAFTEAEKLYGEKFNFVFLDVASKDTKAFNKIYHIYPNMPYVLFFKDRGRISRFVQKDCVLKESCFNERLDFFSR